MIITKLTYGLETLQFTEYVGNKLNTFQMKGLRKILKIPPTHINKTWTNQKVFDTASEALEKVNPKTCKTTTRQLKH